MKTPRNSSNIPVRTKTKKKVITKDDSDNFLENSIYEAIKSTCPELLPIHFPERVVETKPKPKRCPISQAKLRIVED